MTRPAVTDTAEQINTLLGPLNERDSDANGWAGLLFAAAVAGMLQGLDVIADDTDTHLGWGTILDYQTAPVAWLPWLAALYGVTLITGGDEQANRDRIRDLPAQRRGNPDTLIAAMKATLTGDQAVWLFERDTDAYHFTTRTRAAETPTPDSTHAAALSQKVGGLNFTQVVSDTWVIAEVERDYVTIGGLETAFATIGDLETYHP